ncbi:helix-turn-helix transcriptional regulator [Pelagibius litoralis]|uniref:Helix-turn-helix transcriptional regulator n=1 Tax=Pelagibius litoralis TaxID=374515 RepID=A0A967F2V9_9PROT|nr:helix-turn-helix transcriptional regulator [Pelagibius litoralis]NIA72008.1 helix-turn-helix transcriptional regulator [Pelagibius litoralis]
MTPAQCRGARGLLDWTQEELGDASGVSTATVRAFEHATRPPNRSTVKALGFALEAAGIIFIEENGGGAGVRLRDRAD